MQQPNHSTTNEDTYNKTWALKDPCEQTKNEKRLGNKNNGGEDEEGPRGEGKKQRMHFQRLSKGAEGCSAQ